MVSLGRSKSSLHLCFVFDGPFSHMLLHIEYGSDKQNFLLPYPCNDINMAKLVYFFKDGQKILSKYGFFQFFFVNTLGVLGKGL